VLLAEYKGEGRGSAAAERALGRDGELVDVMVGYGEPMPYRGISKFDELLTLYWGTSFKTKSSGTWRSACEVSLGDTAGALFASELFDRAEEERGREVIVIRASSYMQTQRAQSLRCDLLALPCVPERKIPKEG
jgi:hypothetical protein